jgi:dephospho-CoA kinase
MKTIGLTGGIGSGKTTVSEIFIQLGIPVFYADQVAKKAYLDDKVRHHLRSVLGEQSLFKNGEVDTKKLASLIFSDDEKLAAVNAIVHPWVRLSFQKWLPDLPPRTPYCILEAAILVESGGVKQCDKLIVVKSDVELRIKRVMDRDQISRELVLQRMNRQTTDEQLERFADFLIHNDGNQSLIRQVLKIHYELLK